MSKRNPDEVKFHLQKRHATKVRNIEWDLSFEQWYEWWQATGHYHERGVLKGQYVMARHGDAGPYALHNIKCITNTENANEKSLNGNSNKGKKLPQCGRPSPYKGMSWAQRSELYARMKNR